MPNDTIHPQNSILFSSIRQGSATVRSRYLSSVSCPHCGQHKLQRIHRRLVDRLLGSFVTLRRFKCCDSRCHWEGNLVQKRTATLSPLADAGTNAIVFSSALLSMDVANKLRHVLGR